MGASLRRARALPAAHASQCMHEPLHRLRSAEPARPMEPCVVLRRRFKACCTTSCYQVMSFDLVLQMSRFAGAAWPTAHPHLTARACAWVNDVAYTDISERTGTGTGRSRHLSSTLLAVVAALACPSCRPARCRSPPTSPPPQASPSPPPSSPSPPPMPRCALATATVAAALVASVAPPHLSLYEAWLRVKADTHAFDGCQFRLSFSVVVAGASSILVPPLHSLLWQRPELL